MARLRLASVLTATLLLGSFGASSFVIAFGSRAQPLHPLRTVTPHRTAIVQPAENDARQVITIAEEPVAAAVADSVSASTAPVNVPEVIAAFAAWSQDAVPVAPAPNEPAYRVHLSDDKYLAGRLSLFDPATGRLIPGENVVVHFLRHGQIMSETKLGIGGVFQAVGLLPGVYSVIAVGDGGFAAFSVEVLPVVNPDPGAVAGVRDAVGLQIDAALVPIQVVPLVLNVVQQSVPPFAAQLPAAPMPVGPVVPFGRNVVPLVEPVAPWAVAGPRAPIKTPLIVRSPDGRVTGRALRLHPVSGLPMPVSGAKVALIRNGTVAREATTDAAGLFALQDDGTSPVSVLIASAEGVSVFSVGYTTREEIRPPTTPAPPPVTPEVAPNAVEATGVSWSSRQEPQLPRLGTAPLEATLIPPEDLLLLQQLLPPPLPPAPPMIGGGFGGGFGGGGGGGGGGGLGLLGLAGLAGLAGLGGNDNNQPAPASPFIP